jgi:hypothetical protein
MYIQTVLHIQQQTYIYNNRGRAAWGGLATTKRSNGQNSNANAGNGQSSNGKARGNGGHNRSNSTEDRKVVLVLIVFLAILFCKVLQL